jgi:hypothetical protein
MLTAKGLDEGEANPGGAGGLKEVKWIESTMAMKTYAKIHENLELSYKQRKFLRQGWTNSNTGYIWVRITNASALHLNKLCSVYQAQGRLSRN